MAPVTYTIRLFSGGEAYFPDIRLYLAEIVGNGFSPNSYEVRTVPTNDLGYRIYDLYSGSESFRLTQNFYDRKDGSVVVDQGSFPNREPSYVVNVDVIGITNTASPPSSGNDDLIGTERADRTSLLSGADRYRALAGDDLVFGNAGTDLIYGNAGADTLYGGQGDDTLFGGRGDDVLFGDLGDDVLSGDLGNDILRGGAGADRYVFDVNSGADVVLGFDAGAGDRLDLHGQTYRFGTAADGSGSALLILSGGGTIELAGITQSRVDAGFFA